MGDAEVNLVLMDVVNVEEGGSRGEFVKYCLVGPVSAFVRTPIAL